jgi:hypothetical protein
MPKYGMVTYKSRKQSGNVSAQTEFDRALAAKNDDENTGNRSKNNLERTKKFELKIKRGNKPLDGNKKRKLNPLLEDELFGFTESDSESHCSSGKDRTLKRPKSPCKSKSPTKQNSSDSSIKKGSPFKVNSPFKNISSPFKNKSPLKSNLKSPLKNSPSKGVEKTVKFDDKSTDDAYGSSQEPNVARETDCAVEDDRPTQKQVCYAPVKVNPRLPQAGDYGGIAKAFSGFSEIKRHWGTEHRGKMSAHASTLPVIVLRT